MNILDLTDVIAGADRKADKMLQDIERKFNRPGAEILNGIVYQQSKRDGAQHSPEVTRRMEAHYGKGI
jgi:hypothetical protein